MSVDTWHEPVRVYLVDFITGETLVDRFVKPYSKVKDWRSEVTRIDAYDMSQLVKRGEALAGWREARAEVWRHIDAQTFVVGCAVYRDLEALGMLHTRVVDAQILANEALGCGARYGKELAELCRSFLGVDILQRRSDGRCPPVMELWAARELTVHMLKWPNKLADWARSQATRLPGRLGEPIIVE